MTNASVIIARAENPAGSKRWYWDVNWERQWVGVAGWTRTRLGARLAVWRAKRRGPWA